MGLDNMIKIFMPLIVIVLNIYDIGTFINYQSLGYNYDIGVTQATRLNDTSISVTVEVFNHYDDTLYVGEYNLEAYRNDTQEGLDRVSCGNGFQVVLNKNQSGSGTVCWISDRSLANTDITIVYNHSFFIKGTVGWKLKK